MIQTFNTLIEFFNCLFQSFLCYIFTQQIPPMFTSISFIINANFLSVPFIKSKSTFPSFNIKERNTIYNVEIMSPETHSEIWNEQPVNRSSRDSRRYLYIYIKPDYILCAKKYTSLRFHVGFSPIRVLYSLLHLVQKQFCTRLCFR